MSFKRANFTANDDNDNDVNDDACDVDADTNAQSDGEQDDGDYQGYYGSDDDDNHGYDQYGANGDRTRAAAAPVNRGGTATATASATVAATEMCRHGWSCKDAASGNCPLDHERNPKRK